MAIDWLTLEKEYITSKISYRKLAEKHGIRYPTIQERATRDKWPEKRKKHQAKTVAKTVSKISEQESTKAAKIHNVAGALMDKIANWVDNLDAESLNSKEVRQICASLVDLKALMDIRSEDDHREQRARISALERQAAKEDSSKEAVQVVMDERLEDLCQ